MDVSATPVTMDKDKILEILSVEDAKKHERVLHGRENDLIESYIRSTFEYLDGENGYLRGYSILERTFTAYLPRIVAPVEIKIRPIVDETSVALAVLGADGTYTDVPAASLTLWRQDECLWLDLARAVQQLRVAHPRATRLTFKAGHAEAEDVPAGIRQAMLLLVGHWYQNREAAFADPRSAPVSREIRFGVRAVVAKCRLDLDLD